MLISWKHLLILRFLLVFVMMHGINIRHLFDDIRQVYLLLFVISSVYLIAAQITLTMFGRNLSYWWLKGCIYRTSIVSCIVIQFINSIDILRLDTIED